MLLGDGRLKVGKRLVKRRAGKLSGQVHAGGELVFRKGLCLAPPCHLGRRGLEAGDSELVAIEIVVEGDEREDAAGAVARA